MIPDDNRFIDLSGQRFGKISVVRFDATDRFGNHKWIVRCDCGNEYSSAASAFKYSERQCFSCSYITRGLKRKVRGGNDAEGNPALYRTYRIWAGAKHRTSSDGRSGRCWKAIGICMCAGWKSNFLEFLNKMGIAPSGKTLDRINNDGHYSCGDCDECRSKGWHLNCRWATPQEQTINRSVTVWLVLGGVKKTAIQWSRQIGISYKTLMNRKSAGWPDDKILTEPIRRGRSFKPKRQRHIL